MCHGAHVKGRGKPLGINSLLLSGGQWGSHSAHKALQQVPFSSKSHQPVWSSAPALDLAAFPYTQSPCLGCNSYHSEFHYTPQHVVGSGKALRKETWLVSFNQALPKHVSLAAQAVFLI